MNNMNKGLFLLFLVFLMVVPKPVLGNEYPDRIQKETLLELIRSKGDEAETENKPETEVEVSKEVSLGTFTATHYTADCYGCSGITKSGYDVRATEFKEGYRVVAVDSAVIPLGTKLIVKHPTMGSFKAVALDTGGAIKGAKIDILVRTKDEAVKLGRVNLEVVLE